MLKKYSLKALEKALNAAVALDPLLTPQFFKLEGKVIKLIIAPMGVEFYLRFERGKIRLDLDLEGAVDTVIESTPLGFIRLSLLPLSKARSLFNDGIKISGNIELGQEMKRIMDTMDIDWEGHLASFTGDVVAYHLGSMVRFGKNLKNDLLASLSENTSDYIQEEQRLLPTPEEIEIFYQEVDALYMDVERLSAEVDLIKPRTGVH